MVTRVYYTKGQELTAEQIAQIEAAKQMPITFDEDSPELTPEAVKRFLMSAAIRDAERLSTATADDRPIPQTARHTAEFQDPAVPVSAQA